MDFSFQSNEVRSSCHMEKEGLVRAVRYFEDNGVAISHLITDRHLQVAKWVRENIPETTSYIDGTLPKVYTCRCTIANFTLLCEHYYRHFTN